MYIQTQKLFGRPLVAALGLFVLAAQACGDDADSTDDVPTIGAGRGGAAPGGSGGAAGNTVGGTGATDAGTGPGEAGTGNEGGSGVGGSDAEGGSDSEGGTGNEGGQSGCVEEPETTEDFLNRCTDSRCAPFDNFSRIEGFTGTLPRL